jgi:hypothetical protein
MKINGYKEYRITANQPRSLNDIDFYVEVKRKDFFNRDYWKTIVTWVSYYRAVEIIKELESGMYETRN